MTSLKSKLSLGLMLSLIILLSLQWMIVTYAMRSVAEEHLAAQLTHEVETILAAVSFNGQGQIVLNQTALNSRYGQTFSGHYYLILQGQQQLSSRSLWDETLKLQPVAQGKQQYFRGTGPLKQPVFILAKGFKKQQKMLTIAVAEDVTGVETSIKKFQLQYAIFSAFGLALLLFVQRFIVFSALKPLQQIQKNITQLAQGESHLIEMSGPTEIQPLVEAFNRLLIGLERKQQRSREALGNLAHSLKTQLTLLNQSAEQPALLKLPNIKASMYDASNTIQKIIDRELKRARLLGNLQPGRKVDLRTVVPTLTDTLQRIHHEKSIVITTNIAKNAVFWGDNEDLLELLGNLLDNACKWCQEQIIFTITLENGLTFHIEDDGVGASSIVLDSLTKRGFRADETKPGSGLGLAIANDIVESYDGTMHFYKSKNLGGLHVQVNFNQSKN